MTRAEWWRRHLLSCSDAEDAIDRLDDLERDAPGVQLPHGAVHVWSDGSVLLDPAEAMELPRVVELSADIVRLLHRSGNRRNRELGIRLLGRLR